MKKSFWNEVARLKEETVVAGWWLVEVLRWWWWFSCQVVSKSCDPMDCSPPGPSVHELSQARILEWVAVLFSRGSFQTQGSNLGLLTCRWILTDWPTREAQGCLERGRKIEGQDKVSWESTTDKLWMSGNTLLPFPFPFFPPSPVAQV